MAPQQAQYNNNTIHDNELVFLLARVHEIKVKSLSFIEKINAVQQQRYALQQCTSMINCGVDIGTVYPIEVLNIVMREQNKIMGKYEAVIADTSRLFTPVYT